MKDVSNLRQTCRRRLSSVLTSACWTHQAEEPRQSGRDSRTIETDAQSLFHVEVELWVELRVELQVELRVELLPVSF